MRLTALCICGTLLAFSSLCWTAADWDEGDLLEANGFGPCTATLRPEGPCRQWQDGSSCPYLFSLPPLTVHLPKQLRELEEIAKDLQKLKDNVDQLRKMCADCTVSQTERERENMNEGKDRHTDERKWLNERDSERLKDFSQECGTDRVKAEKTDGDTDSEKGINLEEKGRKKWETERESDKGVVKENEKKETLKEVADKDGKTQTEGTKGKDKLGQVKVPTTGGNERIGDKVRKEFIEKNNERENDRSNVKDGKGNSKGDREEMLESEKERKITSNIKNKEKTEESDHRVWRDGTKETEKKTQTGEDRGSDGIKMSEDHDEHTNKEREQQGEERKKEMEKGIKVERNNEKPKQTESIGRTEKEKAIKEGELEEDKDRETGKEINTEGEKTVQSVQRDSDGELTSNKAIERTDFVSITPTPYSSSLAPRHDSVDSNKAITFASFLPSPPMLSLISHSNTGVTQGTITTAYGLPTQSTGLGAAGISERLNPDAEAGFRTTRRSTTSATISTLGGLGEQITSTTTSTTSTRPGAGLQGRVSSTMATTTTTTPRQNLYTTTFPGVTDHSRWTARKNINSNTKTGVKPLPGRGPKPGEKHKPAIKPEVDQKLKNPKNGRKPDQAPLPDRKTKLDQKQTSPHKKPTTDPKSKPGKDPKRVQIPKPDRRPLPDISPTNQYLKNIQIPKHDQEHLTDQKQLPIQKPKSHQKSMLPAQRPTSHQKPQTVNITDSDKDPLTDREPESVEIPTINQNSKAELKPVRPFKTGKPDQKQTPNKMPKSEEETKPDQRSTLNQYFTPVEEPEPERSETTSFIPKSNQNNETELLENSNENPSPKPKSFQDSTPGQKVTPDHVLIKPPDQKLKPSQKIPKINQRPKPGQTPKLNQKYPELVTGRKTQPNVKSKPDQTPKLNQKHPELVTGQKTQPNVKPKPDQTPQIHQGLKTPQPDLMPNLNPKSASDKVPEAESNKTPKLRPFPRYRPPTGSTVKPDATSIQRPKPSVQLKPSPKTKTDLDPLQISRTTSDEIQNSQTAVPPASGPVKDIVDVTHSPGDTEFSPSRMRTSTLGPKASNSPDTGRFPHLHILPEVFTMSPNSRIMSDLRPQTASQPPSIPMTIRPNKIMRGILPSVIPSTSPGSTKANQESNTDSRLQAKILHNVEETAPRRTPDPDRSDRPDQKQTPQKMPKSEEETKPDQRSTLNQYFTPVEEPEPERSETTSFIPKPNQNNKTELLKNSDENPSPKPKSFQDSTPGQKLTPDHVLKKNPDQKLKPSQKIPKINQKPKSGQTPKLNQKHPGLVTGRKTQPNVKPKPDQIPQTDQGLKTPRPDLNPKSVPDQIPEAESNKTPKLRPFPRYRPPTRSTVKPDATSVQRPKPSVQLKPSPKTKTDLDPLQISRTTSDEIQNSQTAVPPASGPVKDIVDVTHSPGDTEFSPSKMRTSTLGPKASNSPDTERFSHLHILPEVFTMSPNSRIMSDLRPQTATQPPSIPMTTRPNKIMRGILPSVIPNTGPGSTKAKQESNTDSSLQAKILHNVEETAPRLTSHPDKTMKSVLSSSAQTTSTTSPDLRSTNSATSGPEPPAPEASTPSARELRVKINQVAAFFNNTPNPNGRKPDRRPIKHPEHKQGGSRPDRTDSKLPTLLQSKASPARRDCSDHLLRGERSSGVYLVTPDLRSRSFPVLCDMELDGGGWTLLQRRHDGSVSFNRTWAEYRSGFGELDGGEFWLGNTMIHLLTRDRDMVLRVELEDFDGAVGFAEYQLFRVAGERMHYRLTVGEYSGTAGDALRFSSSYDHNNRAFSTPDRDHDRYPSGNCGAYYSSGWWFDACMSANLNGRYYVGKYKGVRDGIYWGTWHNISTEYYPTNDRQSFKRVRMMIRPKGFMP